VNGERQARDWLYRIGLEPEAADELETQCEEALKVGFPHGVSLRSHSDRPDVCRAPRAEVELYFPVRKTGASPLHFTLELPHPVTDEIADTLNRLFGRGG